MKYLIKESLQFFLCLLFCSFSTSLADITSFKKQATEKYNTHLKKAEASINDTEAITKYTDCISSAIDQKAVDQCKQKLPPHLQKNLDKNTPDQTTFVPTKTSSKIFVDCAAIELESEKVICETKELKVLNEKLKNLYKTKKQQTPQEWNAWYIYMSRCKTDSICIEKQYEDQIYKVSH